MDKGDAAFCAFLGFLGGFIMAAILFSWLKGVEYELWRKEAIAHNAASYEIVDPKTGKVEFRWRDEK